MIDEALGLRPKRQKVYQELDQDEVKMLLSRGSTERGSHDVERVQGICTDMIIQIHSQMVNW